MGIPDNLRDCCCFVYLEQHGKRTLQGTAFFISEVLFEDKNTSMTFSFTYLVTAKHIINNIKLQYPDSKIGVRVNSETGGTIDIELPWDSWFYPNDPQLDAVIVPLISRENLNVKTIPTYIAVNSEITKRNEIGIGDEVFITGLFNQHYGRMRNLPIIRGGNIAMMPEDIVRTEYGDIEAYLIELRSIGGLSGSPVYVHKEWAEPQYKRTGHILYWLGMIHGHWETGSSAIDISGAQSEQLLNTGIGIVVPAYKILGILQMEEFMKLKEMGIEQYRKMNVPNIDADLKKYGISKKEFIQILEKSLKRNHSQP